MRESEKMYEQFHSSNNQAFDLALKMSLATAQQSMVFEDDDAQDNEAIMDAYGEIGVLEGDDYDDEAALAAVLAESAQNAAAQNPVASSSGNAQGSSSAS